MTGFTVPLGFPYPQPADPVNGPAQIQALAEAVDASAVSTLAAASAVFPAACKVNGGAMNTTTGVAVNQTFTSPAVYDNRTFFDVIADPAGLTVVEAGWYVIVANVTWTPNTAGFRSITLVEGASQFTTTRVPASPNAGFGTVQNAVAVRNVAASAKIRVSLLQNSGGNLQSLSCNLAMYRVR
jgi:hypothetical protein